MPLSDSRSASTGLIQGLKAHDEEAWQRLLDLYVPLVFSWCRRSGLQAQDAADVVQDVFQGVLRGIAQFRYSRSTDTFRGWLRTIAHNKIRDHFRAEKGRPSAAGGSSAHQRFMEVAADMPESTAEQCPLSALLHRGLERIRAEFEDHTWQAFWLTTVGSLASTEVAQRLDMSPGAVRQAKYKVLRRLRLELGDAA
jgi:RNA polymerase sigma-70 factor (ECF subfamily)